MIISDFIYSWLKDIVFLFIIISLIDLIMPKGSMKKYINFVIGLLVIFTVISPFIKLRTLDFDLGKEVFNNLNREKSDYNNELLINQERQIEELYIKKISENIAYIVENNTEYSVYDINLNISKEDESYGLIKNVDIVLSDVKKADKKNNTVTIERIQTVKLTDETSKYIESQEFGDLKKIVSKELGVDEERISIHINN
ncbi:stage III sporulation protein AF [Wansuia hejianensis]|uniref:Stage III sporulation protein AF n=1 Tax=Wansuia hejianensis TaxID=2763667 RepID=A0A926F276_9FIRM|nr:stage III sporulation protein AF [Wansuia hejianensis]MBC8590575.1 stage III sporulation protein AF [Wansuia hejianensis]